MPHAVLEDDGRAITNHDPPTLSLSAEREQSLYVALNSETEAMALIILYSTMLPYVRNPKFDHLIHPSCAKQATLS